MKDIPEHITPHSIHALTVDQLDELVELIKHRRLSSIRNYELALEKAKQLSDTKARTAMLKQTELISKTLVVTKKNLELLETRVNKIRVLRMELGLD
jgi:hypothetical protein